MAAEQQQAEKWQGCMLWLEIATVHRTFCSLRPVRRNFGERELRKRANTAQDLVFLSMLSGCIATGIWQLGVQKECGILKSIMTDQWQVVIQLRPVVVEGRTNDVTLQGEREDKLKCF